MNPIQTNKPVFFGNNGEVLKNGYIYIGQPNQDPVPTANRKTVTFQDTSGTQFTAQQPLRTGVDGRIVYQATGKPIIALVDGNYSMLIQDENQVIIKNGYTPFVANATTTAGSSTVIYRSTLVDLKAYNGTPGDYVENVGKVTATDGEGARWLVVSNTGSPGDDVDLIDFDNGTQGVRVQNQLYVNKNLSEIAATGESAKAEARDNIGAFEDFTATSVWTGTDNLVNLDSDIVGGYPGNGVYLVDIEIPTGSGRQRIMIHSIDGSAYSASAQPSGNAGLTELQINSVFLQSNQNLFASQTYGDLSAGTVGSRPLNIREILKVG